MKYDYPSLHEEVIKILTEPGTLYPDFVSCSEVHKLALADLQAPHPSVKLPNWKLFNEVTGGFRSREFSILCGSTGVGKTTLLANLSLELLYAHVPHLVASVETGAMDFIKRIYSAILGEDWNSGDAIESHRLKQFEEDYGNIFKDGSLTLLKYDNRVLHWKLMCDILAAVKKHNCKVAMLDNMNFFLEINESDNERVKMDKTIHDLIIFCKHVDVHLIMVMHPKKTDHGRVENEFDIKGSSTAVQEAHNVFLFNRPTEEDQRTGYSKSIFRELKIAKLRRRGKYVGKRIMFKNINSQYMEHEVK